jgi:hypothetical protein
MEGFREGASDPGAAAGDEDGVVGCFHDCLKRYRSFAISPEPRQSTVRMEEVGRLT